MPDTSPSEAQIEILQILWEQEPQTVRQIHEALSQARSVGYTTVLKQIQRMADKGLVEARKTGKSYEYIALVREQQIQKNLFSRLKDNVFRGSAMKLALHALDESQPSDEELDQLQQWLDNQKSDNSAS